MGESSSTQKKTERAVLVGLINSKQPPEKAKEYLDELEFLAKTLGIKTERIFTQRLERPDFRSFIGKGKLEEIQNYVDAEEIDTIIFDDDLTPSQLRNIERELNRKIYDRSLLILEIFVQRAKTAQAKTQVDLARYQYLLPRLTRMWTHLERQRGGTGTRGGAGEKEIETDRRVIRNQITLLKEKLQKIDKQSLTQRKSRDELVRVTIVGYTNVGKSTLMRTLSKADVFAENKLFATVDSTVRKIVLNHIPFLLTDTVGFIRKLPTTLIESFKSTLDEIREADVLIHVVDISHSSFEEQIEVVNQTLVDINAANKSTLLVFNKIDLLEDKIKEGNDQLGSTLADLKASFLNKENQSVVFISAAEKDNIDELKQKLFELVREKHIVIFPNYLKDEIFYGNQEGADQS